MDGPKLLAQRCSTTTIMRTFRPPTIPFSRALSPLLPKHYNMKFSGAAVAALLVVTTSSLLPTAEAFAGLSNHKASSSSFAAAAAAFVPTKTTRRFTTSRQSSTSTTTSTSTTALSMSSSSSGGGCTYTVGIVGATGAVGKEIRQCLEKSIFPTEKLRIFGSSRSADSIISSNKFGDITVELFSPKAARECDVVFLAVSGDFSLEHAKTISDGDDGAVVIDNSSAFRYLPEIPLVVPEINGDETKKSKLIANPNCTTAIGLMALWPLHKLFGLKKIIMSTYQAASGAGQPGMDELQDGTRVYLDGGTPTHSVFAHPLPFNVIPHIDKFQDNGYTKEEMKVTWEARKICSLGEDFPVSCTAVRIPTIRAHSESIIIETEKPVNVQAARKALEEAPGVKLVDDPDTLLYPMPLSATGAYDVEVGRIRKSLVFGDYGLEFFVSGDQLLRGAALNAVLVAEEMNKNGALKSFTKAGAVA